MHKNSSEEEAADNKNPRGQNQMFRETICTKKSKEMVCLLSVDLVLQGEKQAGQSSVQSSRGKQCDLAIKAWGWESKVLVFSSTLMVSYMSK